MIAVLFLALLLMAIGFCWGFVAGCHLADKPAPRWLLRLVDERELKRAREAAALARVLR